jgi:hypothetical protein
MVQIVVEFAVRLLILSSRCWVTPPYQRGALTNCAITQSKQKAVLACQIKSLMLE